VRQLEQAGAHVRVELADVSKPLEAARVLETVTLSMLPLRGIVHAAGVLDDGILLQQNWQRFRQVMAPKVAGAWNLHALTQTIPLDFFVCFSSVASLLGSPGQGNYAAANAFMEALMHHRRAQGLPGLSINWGPWGEVGMVAELSSRDQSRLIRQGWELIAPEKGLRLLEALLDLDTPQVGVLPVNWSKFVGHCLQSVEYPLLKNIVQASRPPVAQPPALLQQLETTPVNGRRAVLMTYLRAQIATVLGMDSPEQMEPRQRLFDLGIDSLMALQLKNRLEPSLGCTLPQTLLFDYPTIEALTDYLVQEVIPLDFSWKSEVEQQQENKAPELCTATLEQLSESEAEVLLLKELEKMNH